MELTVIPADKKIKESIGWTVIERDGWEIYHKPKEELTLRQILDDREWPRDEKGHPLYHNQVLKDEIKEGMEVIIKDNPFDYVYGFATIVKDEKGFHAETKSNYMPLNLSDDDRECCWTSCAVINKKAFTTIKLEKE